MNNYLTQIALIYASAFLITLPAYALVLKIDQPYPVFRRASITVRGAAQIALGVTVMVAVMLQADL